MKLLYEKFEKLALLRAVFFAITGIATLLFTGFLRGTVFYVFAGYVFLLGIWGFADGFFCSKETRAFVRYGNFIVAAFMIVFGILSIIYSRYLVRVAPLYLGGLMLVNGFVYFLATLCAKTRLQWFLALLSLSVLLGGGAIVIFTFGFEIVLTLAEVSSITLLLSCAYELIAHLIYRKSNYDNMEREEMK